ncbi:MULTISPECIES: HD domain-containing phosphohydrolase [unclassified Agarivorans]|uniref:HD-GYP domain-containing protein n=1 Tax=unclassified Agarivorans TaxID=2636026 RepID=UPI003D7E1E21
MSPTIDSEQIIQINMRHALLAIAKALDFVGVDDMHHGQRVAYMAYECAKRMTWTEAEQQFTYFSGLIHDCGVSSTEQHLALLDLFQPESTEVHCLHGYQALLKCPVIHQFANVVRYHHTPWEQLAALNIAELDKRVAALVFVADRLDFLRAQYTLDIGEEQIILHETAIAEILQSNRGRLFHPQIVDSMCELVAIDGFWYNMNISHIEKMGLSFQQDQLYDQQLSLQEAAELARFLARIVDAKSPFTFQHSDKVAILAQQLALASGISARTAEMIYIAGLLHDVGKLRTPDGLLHKSASFSEEEYAQIKRHTVDTSEILVNFFPKSPIGAWASNHHERLDGSGYPFRKTANDLDIPSRVIAIADVFQALTQQRPYRDALDLQQVFNIMGPLVQTGKLDKDIYNLLQQNAEFYFQLSQNNHHESFSEIKAKHFSA